MKILIFGASGFLGTKLIEIFSQGNEVMGVDVSPKNESIKKLDAMNFSEVQFFVNKHKPDLIIDTIALTSSVLCERSPHLAKDLNFLTAKNIADSIKSLNIPMIFISSSYIFDGKKGNYSETDVPNITNIYAKYKLEAEKEVLRLAQGIVLRVDIMYGYNKADSLSGVFENFLSGKEIFVGNPHQTRSPLFVEDIPEAILKLLRKNQRGIFNLAGSTKISHLEFLEKLEQLTRKDSRIKILDEEDLLVKPLKDSSLNLTKINLLGIKTTSLEEGLNVLQKQL